MQSYNIKNQSWTDRRKSETNREKSETSILIKIELKPPQNTFFYLILKKKIRGYFLTKRNNFCGVKLIKQIKFKKYILIHVYLKNYIWNAVHDGGGGSKSGEKLSTWFMDGPYTYFVFLIINSTIRPL